MKRLTLVAGIVLSLSLSACAPAKTESTTEPVPAAETKPDAAAPAPASTVLSTHYMDAAAALADDNLEKAKASLAALAKESTGELQKLAQDAADTGDIAATRERFKALSVVATGMDLPDGYAVAFCPMYKGGSKWVQKKDKLANPYYGKAMLTCGSFIN